MKIFIPNILSYKGEQLTESTLENFKNLIYHGLGSQLTRAYTGDKLAYVSFYWGSSDYPDYIKVNINEYFLFNEEDEEQYLIIDKLKDDWIIISDNGEKK